MKKEKRTPKATPPTMPAASRKRAVYLWRVCHPDHAAAEVVSPSRYKAVIAAAKVWGVPWTTIARACSFERLEEVADA